MPQMTETDDNSTNVTNDDLRRYRDFFERVYILVKEGFLVGQKQKTLTISDPEEFLKKLSQLIIPGNEFWNAIQSISDDDAESAVGERVQNMISDVKNFTKQAIQYGELNIFPGKQRKFDNFLSDLLSRMSCLHVPVYFIGDDIKGVFSTAQDKVCAYLKNAVEKGSITLSTGTIDEFLQRFRSFVEISDERWKTATPTVTSMTPVALLADDMRQKAWNFIKQEIAEGKIGVSMTQRFLLHRGMNIAAQESLRAVRANGI